MDPTVNRYLTLLTATLRERLGERLDAVCLFGSAAYGAYLPGSSDLDVQAVISAPLDASTYRGVAAAISHDVLPCPARKLEFVLYTLTQASTFSQQPEFELNFNSGAELPDHLSLDIGEEGTHWFILDIAMGRELGVALFGPPPAEVFAPVPGQRVKEAILDSMAWHRAHELASVNSVTNACRGWRYVATGTWGSKRDGLRWAVTQPAASDLLAEVQLAAERGSDLDGRQVARVLDTLEEFIRALR